MDDDQKGDIQEYVMLDAAYATDWTEHS